MFVSYPFQSLVLTFVHTPTKE
ncbi:CopG family transcriptional regulator, partial [Vibrio parahaemolyticus]